MINQMEMVFKLTEMGLCIKGNFQMEKNMMMMDNLDGLMEKFTKDNLKMDIWMGMDN